MKVMIAEFIGTFILSLIVICGVTNPTPPLAVPVLASITLAIMVYLFGSISGAHINPGVSFGLWWHGKINLLTMFKYMIAQFSGAFVASLFATRFLKLNWQINSTQSISVAWAELIGVAMLTMAVGFVAYGRVKDSLSGIVVGGGLLLGITFAINVSNGILNPAVAIALGSGSIPYLAAPLVGGVVGIFIGKFFSEKK